MVWIEFNFFEGFSMHFSFMPKQTQILHLMCLILYPTQVQCSIVSCCRFKCRYFALMLSFEDKDKRKKVSPHVWPKYFFPSNIFSKIFKFITFFMRIPTTHIEKRQNIMILALHRKISADTIHSPISTTQ